MGKITKKNIIIICIVILIGLIAVLSVYLGFVGISTCGGIDGKMCPNGFSCVYPRSIGTTFADERGSCVLNFEINKKEVTDLDCNPPVGAPANWEAPYSCLVR
ncbi:MAG: hypothetical protein WCP14_00170 [bacterium]